MDCIFTSSQNILFLFLLQKLQDLLHTTCFGIYMFWKVFHPFISFLISWIKLEPFPSHVPLNTCS